MSLIRLLNGSLSAFRHCATLLESGEEEKVQRPCKASGAETYKLAYMKRVSLEGAV